MDINQLLEMLDITSPEEFSYFENFADLLECEKEIEYDSLYQLLSKVETDKLKELVEGYFEDISDSIPTDSLEMYTLMETIKRVLVGILSMIHDEDEELQIGLFVDEIYKLRDWYTKEDQVHCVSTNHRKMVDTSVCQAFYLNRLEKLTHTYYFYNFGECLDYPIEEYAMAIRPLIHLEDQDDDLIDIYDDASDYYGDDIIDENY